MSEDALAKHIDERIALGDSAPPPADPQTRDLSGTVRLAQAALTSSNPPEDVERESRERVVSQLRQIAEAKPRSEGGKGFLGKLQRLFGKRGA
jgi:hypothetical protein